MNSLSTSLWAGLYLFEEINNILCAFLCICRFLGVGIADGQLHALTEVGKHGKFIYQICKLSRFLMKNKTNIPYFNIKHGLAQSISNSYHHHVRPIHSISNILHH